MRIGNGLRADIFRKQIEDKNSLTGPGSLYVGTEVEECDGISATDSLIVGSNNSILSCDNSSLQYRTVANRSINFSKINILDDNPESTSNGLEITALRGDDGKYKMQFISSVPTYAGEATNVDSSVDATYAMYATRGKGIDNRINNIIKYRNWKAPKTLDSTYFNDKHELIVQDPGSDVHYYLPELSSKMDVTCIAFRIVLPENGKKIYIHAPKNQIGEYYYSYFFTLYNSLDLFLDIEEQTDANSGQCNEKEIILEKSSNERGSYTGNCMIIYGRVS